MRDITLGETFYEFFTTRAFATGVPTTLGGTPALSVLEENNATPITAGVSVSVDRASVTGLNEATIVATGGNGFEAGKSYAIYISTGTVGGTSVVGEVVGRFTIQQSAAFTRLGAPAGASVSADMAAVKSDTAAILVDTAEIGVAGAGLTNINLPNQTMDIVGDITGNLSGSVGSVTGAVGSVTGSVGSVVANVDANLVEIFGDAGGVDALDRSTRTMVMGTVDAASTTTSITTSSLAPAAAVTDQFKGRIVIFDEDTTTANLRGQATDITGSSSGGVLTVTALTTAPVSGDTFIIV